MYAICQPFPPAYEILQSDRIRPPADRSSISSVWCLMLLYHVMWLCGLGSCATSLSESLERRLNSTGFHLFLPVSRP